MAQFTQYLTLQGDRWDNIAWKAYGTVGQITVPDGRKLNAFEYIIEQNPQAAIHKKFPAGIRLKIPIIDRAEIVTDTELLPPWKR